MLNRPLSSATRYTLIGIAALAAIAIVTVLAFPWHVLRGPLEGYLSHSLKRAVTIGSLDVALGRVTHLRLVNVTIANVVWSSEQPMAEAEVADLFFTLGSLLRGEPDYARLVEPAVLLERNAEGMANWHFEGEGHWPDLAAVDVERGRVRYRHLSEKTDLDMTLATEAVEGDRWALRVTGRGKLHGETFTLDARGGGLMALSRVTAPYAVELAASSGRTQMRFDGTIVPGEPENVRGTLEVRGPDLSDLYPIVPTPFPWTPPYSLKGELTHASGLWSFRRFAGRVGESDLSGDFRIDASRPRAKTIADLASNRFNYADLGGFIGLPPGRPATAEQKTEAARRAASRRVLPERGFDLTALRGHDADVKFRGKAVRFGDTPLDNVVSHLRLQDGVMRFEPLDFGVGGGHAITNVTIDLNRTPPAAEGQVEVRAVEVERIYPKLAPPGGTIGRLAGRAHFNAKGSNIAAMAATLDGDAALILRGGEASKLQIVLTNLDLARAATLLLRGDETSSLRCAVLAVHARSGVVRPELFVVDTSEVVINGEGIADLGNERLDITLTARSKRPSLVALRGPIVVDGTFANPRVHPALVQAGARLGAAVGLGALAPPLALLPLLDLGGAEDVDCRAIIDEARVRTDTTERIPRAKAAAQKARANRESGDVSRKLPARTAAGASR